MCMFDRPLEKIESQTLPRIGRLSSLTQLLRNFADTDMNSWQVVIALIVLFAYVYPSMRFLPLIVLTTLVHRFSVANPAERTAARREISSESHGPSRDPRSKPPVTSTAEMDKSKNSNLSEIISNFFLRLSVLYCAWRGRQDKGLTIWDLVMLAGASQYLFVYAFWRFRLLPVKVALVAKYPKSEITIRRWIPLPKPAVRIYRWFTVCPFFVPPMFHVMTDEPAVPSNCANNPTKKCLFAHGVLRDRLCWAVLFRHQCSWCKVCNPFLCTNNLVVTRFSVFLYSFSLQFFAIQW